MRGTLHAPGTPVLFGKVSRDCSLAPIRWPEEPWECAFVPIDMLDLPDDERDGRWIREQVRNIGAISLVVWKGLSAPAPTQARQTCGRMGLGIVSLGQVTAWRAWGVGGVLPLKEAGIGSRGIW